MESLLHRNRFGIRARHLLMFDFHCNLASWRCVSSMNPVYSEYRSPNHLYRSFIAHCIGQLFKVFVSINNLQQRPTFLSSFLTFLFALCVNHSLVGLMFLTQSWIQYSTMRCIHWYLLSYSGRPISNHSWIFSLLMHWQLVSNPSHHLCCFNPFSCAKFTPRPTSIVYQTFQLTWVNSFGAFKEYES